ncbi:MAG: PHP domain-containing protein [Ignavibacteriales bacterium]|nr:MAG: PHP domain-containing protein [Ignavibacteriales bacterium]
MIDEVARQGFIYAAVCDHSKSAFYANGLKEDRILQQRKEIDDFNKSSKIKVYHGIESDILKDGSLDYSEDILSEFQFIVASIHSLFNLSEVEMTNRIIRAVENPYTDILAHPTGRLLLSRDGYKVNIKKVIDACVANRVAIEINANPHRLDLDWRNLYYAREKGCLISINPDAHSTDGVSNIEYGIMIARKAGVQPREVLNCYEEKEFIKFINRKVKRTT